ncbi:XRE family transcriptional regulator [Weissella confusa]|uniref:helix-turn-helix domain-containing protein n=1 Tax=Weissella TaxID=46255 RepID=UPI000EEF4F7C|nr:MULTISPECIES: helix-turn-helix transcriptional regulator [Weissella]MBJ7650351.1 helix-turn-helix transcriptional regulator [Weissella confusa]MBJ7651789.1 helix-turn-helix transcriptional regulator [Weissella confusa]MBJ7662240.1 helix-turn-helix transcriptional regulator [Weissella confusa]MBZ5941546.1 helix-turn-helix transcriptional regulator [Weissella cibaria]MCQ9619215.1 helix-turn-helix transcriptional regulator [Weissella cibaria]
MTVFERIKELAKKRGYSLTRLNNEAGLGTNSIYHWRTKSPSTASLKKVADVLGVSVDYLLGNTDEMHSNKRDDNVPIDLDKALSEEGMAMFDGQPLSDEYKKALLAMLKTMKGND